MFSIFGAQAFPDVTSQTAPNGSAAKKSTHETPPPSPVSIVIHNDDSSSDTPPPQGPVLRRSYDKAYEWAVSAKKRNRLAHALNGNQSKALVVVSKRKPKKDKIIEIITPGVKAARQQKQKSKGQKRPSPVANFCRAYAHSIADPFMCLGPSMGFNHWNACLTSASAYARSNGVTGALGSGYFILSPDAYYSTLTGAQTTAAMSNFLTLNTNATSAQLVSVGNGAFPAFNLAAYQPFGSVARLKAAGIRVTVASAATAVPGLLFVGRLPGCRAATDLDGFSVDSFAQLAGFRTYVQESGACTITIPWAPVDYADMEFAAKRQISTFSSSNAASLYQPLVIAFSGVATGSRFSVEVIANIEIEMGATVGSASITSTLTSDSGPLAASVVPSLDYLVTNALPDVDLNGSFSLGESYNNILGQGINSFVNEAKVFGQKSFHSLLQAGVGAAAAHWGAGRHLRARAPAEDHLFLH